MIGFAVGTPAFHPWNSHLFRSDPRAVGGFAETKVVFLIYWGQRSGVRSIIETQTIRFTTLPSLSSGKGIFTARLISIYTRIVWLKVLKGTFICFLFFVLWILWYIRWKNISEKALFMGLFKARTHSSEDIFLCQTVSSWSFLHNELVDLSAARPTHWCQALGKKQFVLPWYWCLIVLHLEILDSSKR